MKLKDDSINLVGLRPETLFAINVVYIVYKKHGRELVITSINDGKHSGSSLHYSGCAFDCRTSYFDTNTIKSVVSDIKDHLNKDFDVILEGDHIHVEFQPRR